MIAFDQISLSEVVATNDFASWASDNGLTGSDADFNADPDNDGIPNGLESFLGTLPGTRSGGMSNIAKTANGVSMQHPYNSDLSLTLLLHTYGLQTLLIGIKVVKLQMVLQYLLLLKVMEVLQLLLLQ